MVGGTPSSPRGVAANGAPGANLGLPVTLLLGVWRTSEANMVAGTVGPWRRRGKVRVQHPSTSKGWQPGSTCSGAKWGTTALPTDYPATALAPGWTLD